MVVNGTKAVFRNMHIDHKELIFPETAVGIGNGSFSIAYRLDLCSCEHYPRRKFLQKKKLKGYPLILYADGFFHGSGGKGTKNRTS